MASRNERIIISIIGGLFNLIFKGVSLLFKGTSALLKEKKPQRKSDSNESDFKFRTLNNSCEEYRRFDYPQPTKFGTQQIRTQLQDLNRRRIKKIGDSFQVNLWHADRIGQIWVYPYQESSESSNPLGLIPGHLYQAFLPYMDDRNGNVSYSTEFNKMTDELVAQLWAKPLEEIKKEKEDKDAKLKEIDDRRSPEWLHSLQISYKLKKLIHLQEFLGVNYKGNTQLNNPSIILHDRDKYHDRFYKAVDVMEDGKKLCEINADPRIIRHLYSGHEVEIKEYSFKQEDNYSNTLTYLNITIGAKQES